MIGKKSILKFVSFTRGENQLTVRIQANKNHGICAISVGHFTNVPRNGKIIKKFVITERMPNASDFFGRQYDDEFVIEHLINVLQSYE